MPALLEFISAVAKNEKLLLLAGGILLALICTLCVLAGRQFGRLEMSRDIKHQRKDAVKRSRSVLAGQVYEQIAPLLPGFPCDINNVQFIGRPVDFVGFCTDSKSGNVEEIVFIEVKSGGSTLSAREKSVREAVEKHRVRYVEYRIP